MLKRMFVPGVTALALMPLLGAASLPVYADGLSELFPADGFYASLRHRFEEVDQNGFADDAQASTLRTRLGYKTGTVGGFQALIEVEDVSSLGSDNFNNSVNGNTGFPVIADPVGTEINQAWVSYAGIPDTGIKVGRQGINLDNQRFIGTVGWRQNDQTFDSVLITNSSIENLSLAFAQVDQVNRINGEDHPLGKLDTKTRVAHATYKASDSLSVTGYGYWLDHDPMAAAALSSRTYGLRLTGSTQLNDNWKLAYEVEAAEQDDYGDNPASYDATYFHISPALKWKTLTLQAGYESLEGDGVSSFKTPLATLHKFNGWADKFLATPANGLEDMYVKVAYVIKGQGNLLDNTKLVAVYHEFEAENGGADYGDEVDLLIAHPINTSNIPFVKNGSIALKYADYTADTFATDTQKLWLTTQFNF